jgi:putative methyltransferase (TIGR04325 family)
LILNASKTFAVLGLHPRLGAIIMTDEIVTINYGYPDWESARQASAGYDADAIIEKVTNAARAVRDGRAVYERDTVTFNEIEYAWPFLSSLMLAAADCGRLHVLDVGGSLGSSFRQVGRFFQILPASKSWNIVEQTKLVEIGRREFETDQLKFFYSISECAERCDVDVALLLGSLHYFEDPYGVLKELIYLSPRYIILDRTPVKNTPGDEIAVQTVRPPIYNGSFPTWIFNQSNLTGFLADQYESVERWRCPGQPDPHSVSKGYLFRRRVA